MNLRSGRDQGRISGAFNVRTEFTPLFGSHGEIITRKIGEDGDTTLPAVKAIGTGNQVYEFSLLGPIYNATSSGLSFHIAGRYNQFDHYGENYEVYDADEIYLLEREEIARQVGQPVLKPTNLGRLPNTDAFSGYLYGELDFEFGKHVLRTTGELGAMRRQLGAWSTLYMLDAPSVYEEASKTFIPDPDAGYIERDHQTAGQNFLSYRGDIEYKWEGNATQFSLGGGYTFFKNETGRRVAGREYGMFDLWEIAQPFDMREGGAGVDYFLHEEDPNGAIDQYEEILNKDRVALNPLTGFFEGRAWAGASYNPYGMVDTYFPAHGQSSYAGGPRRGFEFREVEEWRGRGEIRTGLSKVIPQVRAGFDMSFWTLRHHYNSIPWDPRPFHDVYGYQASYWLRDTTNQLQQFFAKPHTPLSGVLFSEVEITLPYISIKPGLRVDLLDPDAPILTPFGIPLSMVDLDTLPSASLKAGLSPALSVTYDLHDHWSTYLKAAILHTVPNYRALYDDAYADLSRGAQTVGNPDLGLLSHSLLEFGLSTERPDTYHAEVILFHQQGEVISYKLRYAFPNAGYVATKDPLYKKRGMEVNVWGRPLSNMNLEAHYRLQQEEVEIYTAQNLDSLAFVPSNSDRTHQLTTTLKFCWNDKEGFSIGGIKLLENVTASLTGQFMSGRPYTRISSSGSSQSEFNSERYPAQFLMEAHLEKGFLLRDWVGEWADRLSISLYIDIRNLLNATSYLGVSSFVSTLDPEDSSIAFLNKGINEFPATPYFRDEDPNRPETIGSAQYDRYGSRLYNVYADADRNGVVTQIEKYEAYKRYAYTQLSRRSGYQYPREVWLGMKIRF